MVVYINRFKERRIIANLHIETDHGPVLRDGVHDIVNVVYGAGLDASAAVYWAKGGSRVTSRVGVDGQQADC